MPLRIFVALFVWLAVSTIAKANDSHAGYYYPEPNTSEVYVSSVDPMPDANKVTRVGFTVGLNAQQLKRAYPPQYHIFAKGAHAQKLIIVASGHTRYDTLYRLRALLAGLTAEARTSPLFRQARNPENLTFLDLLRMTGFEQVTVSDGADLAHRITLR
ncbi:MAG: hypothetical protein AAFO61_09255 [Pseudomonadota bacterium]